MTQRRAPVALPLSTPPAGKMKALAKEVRGFSGRTRLPIYAASSICLRYDPREWQGPGSDARWLQGEQQGKSRGGGGGAGHGVPILPAPAVAASAACCGAARSPCASSPVPYPRPLPACCRTWADRMDKMRALITGPEDTPYYGGCFIFDIYLPGEDACGDAPEREVQGQPWRLPGRWAASGEVDSHLHSSGPQTVLLEAEAGLAGPAEHQLLLHALRALANTASAAALCLPSLVCHAQTTTPTCRR